MVQEPEHARSETAPAANNGGSQAFFGAEEGGNGPIRERPLTPRRGLGSTWLGSGREANWTLKLDGAPPSRIFHVGSQFLCARATLTPFPAPFTKRMAKQQQQWCPSSGMTPWVEWVGSSSWPSLVAFTRAASTRLSAAPECALPCMHH